MTKDPEKIPSSKAFWTLVGTATAVLNALIAFTVHFIFHKGW